MSVEDIEGLPPLRWAPPVAETVTRLVLEIDADGKVCAMNFKAIEGKEAKGCAAAMRLGALAGKKVRNVG